jgi:hypothetical protein
MTIFAVLMPSPQPNLAEIIAREFPDDHLSVTDTQWLISSTKTILDITTQIGIYDPKNPEATSTGVAIVISVAAYHGRAPQTVWDWIRAKLESPRSVG